MLQLFRDLRGLCDLLWRARWPLVLEVGIQVRESEIFVGRAAKHMEPLHEGRVVGKTHKAQEEAEAQMVDLSATARSINVLRGLDAPVRRGALVVRAEFQEDSLDWSSLNSAARASTRSPSIEGVVFSPSSPSTSEVFSSSGKAPQRITSGGGGTSAANPEEVMVSAIDERRALRDCGSERYSETSSRNFATWRVNKRQGRHETRGLRRCPWMAKAREGSSLGGAIGSNSQPNPG
eukprot:scaffold134138_cov30-Tisochrysis_lutea.AAC.3